MGDTRSLEFAVADASLELLRHGDFDRIVLLMFMRKTSVSWNTCNATGSRINVLMSMPVRMRRGLRLMVLTVSTIITVMMRECQGG